MIALVLVGLILVIAILAVGITAGSRNGLPPAPSRSLFSGLNKNALASSGSEIRTNRRVVVSRPPTKIISVASSNKSRPVQSSPTVVRPAIQNSAVIEPNNFVTTVTPDIVAPTVATDITPAIVIPHRAVIIEPRKAVTITPSAVPAVVVSPAQKFVIEPPPRGAWQERGWTRQNGDGRETYEGFYTAGNRQFNGRIETRNGGRKIAAYIYNPPPEIRQHAHGACFQQVGNGWFLLHWARPARTVDDAILYMERVLDESLHR